MLHHQSRGGGVVQLLRGRAEKCHRHQARVPESKISGCKSYSITSTSMWAGSDVTRAK
ncbi:unnamed protein product, partial [Pylaiella littoralis]